MLSTLLGFVALASNKRHFQPFDDLARKRDVSSVQHLARPELADSFLFLKVPGPFGGGSKGWSADELPTDGQDNYVVFHTPLTVQDYGDRVYKYDGNQLIAYQPEDDEMGVRVDRHDFDISLAPSEKKANFTDRVHLSKIGETKPYFFMRTGENYTITNISDGSQDLAFHQAGGVVAIPTFSGDSATYTITYSGIIDHPEYAGASTKDEMMLTNDYWWLSIGRRPAPYSLRVVMPKDWIAVGQGDEVETKTSDTLTESRFNMDLPVSFYSLSAGKFHHVQKKVDGITYHVWSKDMPEEQMITHLQMMPSAVQFFSRFKPFPFKSYGAYVSDLFGGGALEAYSYATFGTYSLDDFVHETSHTWYGGIVPNTYLRNFWNESFANYCDNYYERYVKIGKQEDRLTAFRLDAAPNANYNLGTCLHTSANDGPQSSDLGYGKGAKALQQLEIEMGQPALEKAMTEFATDHKLGTQGDWDEFETACGGQWKWFFDEWLTRVGYPAFDITNVSWDGKAVNGKVTFSSEPYRLTAEVWVVTGGKGHLEKVVLDPDGKSGTSNFRLELGEKPDRVVFDPYNVILTDRKPDTNLNTIQRLFPDYTVYVDPAHTDWAADFGNVLHPKDGPIPADLNHCLLVGDPETMPAMRPLLAKAGFEVGGDILSFKGLHIDLTEGAAMAIVDLGGGKQCGLLLGKTKRKPKTGLAKVAICDEFGRFLAGDTEPRQWGHWVFNF